MTEKSIVTTDDFIDDPNADLIIMFLRNEYPQLHNGNEESIVTAVTEEMIGSRQVRLAGRPTPESEVAMRDVVRNCIKQSHPIPVLVVSGPKKSVVGESVDIAELSALKTLACLNKRVKTHYPPGITVRIRLEDSTGYYLEEGVKGLNETIERYIQDFSSLIKVLGYDFIEPVREQSLMTVDQLREKADKVLPLIMSYIQDSEIIKEREWAHLDSWKKLIKTGWQGMIPREMRDYYHRRYSNLFPEYDENNRLAVTAKYMAGTLARYQLKAIGALDTWPGFFQINFAPPVPGIPKSMITTRLYYRTVPLSQTKRHMPFWRAKGFVVLNGGTRISLANWNEARSLDFNKFVVKITDGIDFVNICADYIVE